MDSRTGSMAELGTADNSVAASTETGLNNGDATRDGSHFDLVLDPSKLDDGSDNEMDPSTLKVTLFPFVDPSKSTKPVMFDPIERLVQNGSKITIGRRVEPKGEDGKRREDGPFVTVEDNFIGFKSKVVSRSHAEIWVKDGQVCSSVSIAFVFCV